METKKKNKIKHFLINLPKGSKAKWVKNVIQQKGKSRFKSILNKPCSSTSKCISNAFSWSSSNEGDTYWREIYESFENNYD